MDSRSRVTHVFAGILVVGLLFAIAGCDASPTTPATTENAPATSPVAEDTPATSSALSQEEIDGLRWMREEEKLARDSYVTLATQWNVPVFGNISPSEQTHMDAVKTLLDQYGVEDPTAGKADGEFADAELQDLYDQLMDKGAKSELDALEVGCAIEEIDILDLQERIEQTDNADIIRVYENLMKGSRSHLRSFVSQLETRTGTTYAPQYLTPEDYEVIISGSD